MEFLMLKVRYFRNTRYTLLNSKFWMWFLWKIQDYKPDSCSKWFSCGSIFNIKKIFLCEISLVESTFVVWSHQNLFQYFQFCLLKYKNHTRISKAWIRIGKLLLLVNLVNVIFVKAFLTLCELWILWKINSWRVNFVVNQFFVNFTQKFSSC